MKFAKFVSNNWNASHENSSSKKHIFQRERFKLTKISAAIDDIFLSIVETDCQQSTTLPTLPNLVD